jgi:hypothetical protein
MAITSTDAILLVNNVSRGGSIVQQLKRYCTYVMTAGCLCFAACSDKPTEPKAAQPFSLEVRARDTNGKPVSGLRVDAWNVLSGLPTPPVLPARPEPATTIPVPTEFKLHPVSPNPFVDRMSTKFDLPVACSYDVRVTDLVGREVFFWSRSSVPAGTYRVVLRPSVAQLTVYIFEVVAYDSTRVFLTDTTLGAAWSSVPERNTIGRTDLNGALVTSDSLRFPGIFDVPEMALTDYVGTVMGTFEYVDSVRIVLTDSNSLQQSFVRHLRWRRNVIDLVWQP